MPASNPATIHNITLVGTSGGGKTTLVERLLLEVGAIGRMGDVADGNTVSDWTDEEKAHGHSLSVTPIHFEHNDKHVNILDTPGLTDFLGFAITSMPAVEMVAMVIDASKGVGFTSRRLMPIASDRNLPRMIIVNKIDDAQADLDGIVNQIRSTFGDVCLPINLPCDGQSRVINVFDEDHGEGKPDFSSVEEAHTRILEQVVEVSDELTEAYFENGEAGLDKAKVHEAFEKALREGHLVPICFVSARTGVGIKDLLHIFEDYCPTPAEGNPRPFVRIDDDGNEQPLPPKADPDMPTIAHVFKVAADPFVGKIAVFRVHQGTVKAKSELYFNDEKKPIRIGHLVRLNGKEQQEVDVLGPGDIGAVAKIDEITLNGVLHAHGGEHIHLKPLPMPKPMYGQAIELKNHKDEAKFGPAIHKLTGEDPTFIVERIKATKQTVARGMGELHLKIIFEKLAKQFGVQVETETPKVAYKETVTAKAEGHHRHKKQSGGSGEFGEVYLRVEPLPDDHESGFEFENKTVGGSVPKQFMPAIEKGVRMALVDGAIAGYPMQNVRVEVYDGKYHAVDSKEVAFIKAGLRAFVDAVNKAKPVLLEPFVELEITAPANNMGDIAGDLSTKRGRVLDSEVNGDTCIVRAQAPLSEIQNYSNQLKSMTGGSGSFTMDYSHDERTPPHVQAEVVAAYKPHHHDDD
ncbi:MAG: elongation factor G [Phycisphaeraceae bacterium]|nr:elongation factor G [Phycisphaerales bacterium]MCB9859360.1 elongation factor G [Phycisphaeraceae bacterium]